MIIVMHLHQSREILGSYTFMHTKAMCGTKQWVKDWENSVDKYW
jgi:hypothetical protein